MSVNIGVKRGFTMPTQLRTIRSIRELGAFIRDARARCGLTQEALASKAGVSRSWLIGLEQGKRPRAEMDKIFSLLQALGVALSLHSMESSNPHQDDKTFQGSSMPDETFKNAALPLTHMQQYLGKYLPEAATVPFSGVDQIITEAMRARIPLRSRQVLVSKVDEKEQSFPQKIV
ncbi:MAG: helix-turn-helix domain-containing protein [Rothia sp. (in: high G+C Gram-positive bacteria)]|nr:helix-turn-helix domain-containing protein [Rothia sp. (in: high G+C Gram-positive bacteria)]